MYRMKGETKSEEIKGMRVGEGRINAGVACRY